MIECIGTAPWTSDKFFDTRILPKMAVIHKKIISAKFLLGKCSNEQKATSACKNFVKFLRAPSV